MTVSDLIQALAKFAPGAEVMYEGSDFIYLVDDVYRFNDDVVALRKGRDERETNP